MSGRQRRQRKTKQHREEDDRQDVAVRDRREHVRWYEVENRRHQAVRTVLHFGGGLLVLRNITGSQLLHVDAGAWLDGVGEQHDNDDRDRGDDLEIDEDRKWTRMKSSQ